MKKIYQRVFTLILIFIMLLPTVVTAKTIKKEIHQPVTIVFSHDMHSHLEKFPKLKSVIDDIKKKNEVVYVMDAGDFSMGTPYQSVFKTHALELRMMGAVGYDVTTLGNHEFDQRSTGLSSILNAAKKSGDRLPFMVNGNIDWDKTFAEEKYKGDGIKLKKALENYGSEDYKVIEKDGIKIAVFGIFGKNSYRKK